MRITWLVLILLLIGSSMSAQSKKRTKLPKVLREVSGLVYAGPDSLWWHNDSGDGPYLYLTDSRGKLKQVDTLKGVRAVDWEDITTDKKGHLFIGDFGNNLGRRKSLQIYRYEVATGAVDSIEFRYPGQDGSGIRNPGNFNAEAFFYHQDSLHIFTKDILPRSHYRSYHYVLPAKPGPCVAQLRDSIDLKRRVITAAAMAEDGTLVITAYFYDKLLLFFPASAATVYTFKNYPGQQFFAGEMAKRKLGGLFPTQYEAIDTYGDYIWTATEKTPGTEQKMKRKKWPKK